MYMQLLDCIKLRLVVLCLQGRVNFCGWGSPPYLPRQYFFGSTNFCGCCLHTIISLQQIILRVWYPCTTFRLSKNACRHGTAPHGSACFISVNAGHAMLCSTCWATHFCESVPTGQSTTSFSSVSVSESRWAVLC